jgi:hypothetical protein
MSEAATAEEMGMPKHGVFCWTEVITSDVEANKAFYANVFGWEFKQSQATGEDFEYLEHNTPGAYPQGALFKMTQEMCGDGPIPPPHFMNYIAVDDVDAVAANVEGLGGKMIVPPSDIPNVGRFCMIQDPAGAMVSLIKINQM